MLGATSGVALPTSSIVRLDRPLVKQVLAPQCFAKIKDLRAFAATVLDSRTLPADDEGGKTTTIECGLYYYKIHQKLDGGISVIQFTPRRSELISPQANFNDLRTACSRFYSHLALGETQSLSELARLVIRYASGSSRTAPLTNSLHKITATISGDSKGMKSLSIAVGHLHGDEAGSTTEIHCTVFNGLGLHERIIVRGNKGLISYDSAAVLDAKVPPTLREERRLMAAYTVFEALGTLKAYSTHQPNS